MQTVKAAQEAKRYLEHYYYESKFHSIHAETKLCKPPCQQVYSFYSIKDEINSVN